MIALNGGEITRDEIYGALKRGIPVIVVEGSLRETDAFIKAYRDGDWTYVEVDYNSGRLTRSSINVLHVARGEGYFDDVKLSELLPIEEATTQNMVGDVKRGDHIFHKHVAACVLCHQLQGQGSTVGRALDGIATRSTPAYIRESLLEPSKVLAKGFENLGLSPMPPMGDIFNAQELADIQAYLQTLK